ncbi:MULTISPECIES: antibiotic biosynthesis monooxygenase [unclassified Sinorhizobium]|uniref:antibiotic biosynthesis monooxygenase family protein n=1 Tax=unclassified Sinorhizobium TaxID=2613772 RepID=UPI00352628C5
MRESIYRLDRFAVPAAARDEFLLNVRRTHEILKDQPGFIWDAILEQDAGTGEFNFVTIAEWENETHIRAAKAVVAEVHRKAAFNPQEMFARLGITADIANYKYAE